MMDNLSKATAEAVKAIMDLWTLTLRHYGPGPHEGTGTPQDVHGRGGTRAMTAFELWFPVTESTRLKNKLDPAIIEKFHQAMRASGQKSVEDQSFFEEAWIDRDGMMYPLGGLTHDVTAERAFKATALEMSEVEDERKFARLLYHNAEIAATALGWLRLSGSAQMPAISWHIEMPPTDEQVSTAIKMIAKKGPEQLDKFVWDVNTLSFNPPNRVARYGEIQIGEGADSFYRWLDQNAPSVARSLVLTIRSILRHYGPGPHPSGTPQEIHAGGAKPQSKWEMEENLAGVTPVYHGTIQNHIRSIGRNGIIPTTRTIYGRPRSVYFFPDRNQALIWAKRVADIYSRDFKNETFLPAIVAIAIPDTADESVIFDAEMAKDFEWATRPYRIETDKLPPQWILGLETYFPDRNEKLRMSRTDSPAYFSKEMGEEANQKYDQSVDDWSMRWEKSGWTRDEGINEAVIQRAIQIYFIPIVVENTDLVERHYGPGPHKGTGTSQDVHGGDGFSRTYDVPKKVFSDIMSQLPENWTEGIQILFSEEERSTHWPGRPEFTIAEEDIYGWLTGTDLNDVRVALQGHAFGHELVFDTPEAFTEHLSRQVIGHEVAHVLMDRVPPEQRTKLEKLAKRFGHHLDTKVINQYRYYYDQRKQEQESSILAQSGEKRLLREINAEAIRHYLTDRERFGKLPKTYRDAIENIFAGDPLIRRHYGPGPHKGTGTPQDVHGGVGIAPAIALNEETAWWFENRDKLDEYIKENWPTTNTALTSAGWIDAEGNMYAMPESTHWQSALDALEETGVYSDEEARAVRQAGFYAADPVDDFIQYEFVRFRPYKDARLLAWNIITFDRLSRDQKEVMALHTQLALDKGWDVRAEPATFEMGIPDVYEKEEVKEFLGLTVRHFGPGPHPGTGTPQEIHGGGAPRAAITDPNRTRAFYESIPDIKAELERGKGLGIEYLLGLEEQVQHLTEIAVEAGKNIQLPDEFTEEQKALILAMRDSPEEIEERWRKRLTELGGPDELWMIHIMNEINSATEELGLPPVRILLRRQDDDYDGDTTAGKYVQNDRNPELARIEHYETDRGYRSAWPNINPADMAQAIEEGRFRPLQMAGLLYPSEWYSAHVHEIGHHVEHTSPEFSEARERSYELLGSIEEGVRPENVTPERQLKINENRIAIHGLISEYAIERPTELVAESYTMWKHPQFQELHPKTKELVEYILGKSDDNPFAD